MAKKAKKRKPTAAQIAYYNRNKGRKGVKKAAKKPTPRSTYALPLLNTREQTHGDYGVNAGVSQAIKAVFQGSPEYLTKLSSEQKESAELIATKFGRIVAGDPSNPEHWEDIAGYATLIAERLRAAKAASK